MIALRTPAMVEAVSLVVLLANLATAHHPMISSITGPVHGFAYVMVVVVALLREGTPPRARLAALVPGVGGLIALRMITSRRARSG
ncbi:hypothetical protein NLX83_32910 [Allokutzneria sp. A3M-2-11 16]|uniref:hypothetical protein n=1 Tax=Allokutzneria sp. A3M-2-11 16 TaxID=2962043 RepID=UPI0020B8E0A7|nr:hypothetical protein [Allokutzneria sp. A3M-2-11 16]MCP3804083.1 hypothetical protein [Allokutzneria sp. A3M-2-11 16]